MPDYRRVRVPGGTYFFTINLLERHSDLLVRHIDALREAVRRTRRERPFRIDAWVVLPDHMHCDTPIRAHERVGGRGADGVTALHGDLIAPRETSREVHTGHRCEIIVEVFRELAKLPNGRSSSCWQRVQSSPSSDWSWRSPSRIRAHWIGFWMRCARPVYRSDRNVRGNSRSSVASRSGILQSFLVPFLP